MTRKMEPERLKDQKDGPRKIVRPERWAEQAEKGVNSALIVPRKLAFPQS